MSAVVTGTVVDEGSGEATSSAFFAPTPSDLIDNLIADYRATRKRIEAISASLADRSNLVAIYYFIEGNSSSDRRYTAPVMDKLFELDGAISALNASFWQRALQLTDVLEVMPQKRRDDWFEQIKERKTPDFEEETVRSTLRDLLAMRTQFFAERVDGIFRGLSGEHVTNAPEGFGKRMIMSYVITNGYVSHGAAGLISDLRAVIAKFMGRDEPKYATTSALVSQMTRATGEWHVVDGGALRIRVYKKGTAHLEVHPDMAWRLNQVLAHLHPLAIPARHRQRPARRPKDFPLMQRPLPFEVLDLFAQQLDRYGRGATQRVFRFGYQGSPRFQCNK
jgi:hypothetical protein